VVEVPVDLHAFLHDENYDHRYNPQNLNHAGMVFVGGRSCESLNGVWRVCLDPFDTGLRQNWPRLQPLAFEDRTLPCDYDPSSGDAVPVPSSLNLVKPEWFLYEGGAWFTRDLAYQSRTATERVFLRVGAANYDAKVFLNGEFLGNHYGGSTPFFVELTGRVGSENRLQLFVSNTRTADRVPMHHFDWFNYAGIYREVELLRLPAVFIKDLFVRLVPGGERRAIAVSVTLSEPVATTATCSIPRLGIRATIPIAAGRGDIELVAQPDCWSPERPTLYEVIVETGGDRVADRVGFREITVQGGEILLNGQPVFLRGICVHEDDEETGHVTTREDIARRLAHARELGCNFLRLAHYPHHEWAAQMADEAGIMLWEEIPVYWAVDFGNPATLRDATNQLSELILRDRNRASIILWGLGNENADTDARLHFMKKLAGTARRLDGTRLVSAACLIDKEARRIADRLTAELDVIGINEYYGWYDPDFSELAAIGRNSSPGKPVIVTETGGDALSGLHGAETVLTTEEHQAWIYHNQIATLSGIPWVRGMAPWVLYDFRSLRRQNSHQRGYNIKGLIARDKRTKKAAFATLQAFYQRQTPLG
jgi:beta-glucuronidase